MPLIRHPDKDPEPDDRDPGDPVFLPAWSTLAVLLMIFALLSGVALLAIVKGNTTDNAAETTGLRAYGPADFPEIPWNAPLLPAVVEAAERKTTAVFNVPPAPFSEEGIFPCTGCHADLEVDRARRELGFHEDILLHHGGEDRWCLDCHSADNRDKLHLMTGTEIGFDESYRLCGQCHGTIFRDWRAGIHGQRRGFWNGAKSYLLCAHCHDPHAPKFEPIKALPPPIRPQFLATAGAEP